MNDELVTLDGGSSGAAVHVVIVTGLSGAGKTLALRALEDTGFTAIDNASPMLIPAMIAHAAGRGAGRLALVTDSRSGAEIRALPQTLADLRASGHDVRVLFLDADDASLVRRFKETRRPHPLFTPEGGIVAGIAAERALLADIREIADRVVDTTSLAIPELRALIEADFGDPSRADRIIVTVLSFGFKYGLPLDSDLLFDVRILRNPYWIAALRDLDGLAEPVRDYVMGDPSAAGLVDKVADLLEFFLPQYRRDGKMYVTVAVGCTGGRHRSVVISEMLSRAIRDKGRQVLVQHRDIAATSQGALP